MHIYMYGPRHEVCVRLGGNPEDRFAHDAAHSFTICAMFLYNSKGLQEIPHLSWYYELYKIIRTFLRGIFFDGSRHRIDTNQPAYIS